MGHSPQPWEARAGRCSRVFLLPWGPQTPPRTQEPRHLGQPAPYRFENCFSQTWEASRQRAHAVTPGCHHTGQKHAHTGTNRQHTCTHAHTAHACNLHMHAHAHTWQHVHTQHTCTHRHMQHTCTQATRAHTCTHSQTPFVLFTYSKVNCALLMCERSFLFLFFPSLSFLLAVGHEVFPSI